MRKAILCLLMLVSSLAAHGQQKQPKWTVVYSAVLWDQTTTIPQTTLFTPQKDAVYRLSGYMSGAVERGAVFFTFNWTDPTGTAGSNVLSVPNGTQVNGFQGDSDVFAVQAGTPVVYSVGDLPPAPEYRYNLAFTVELLEGSER
jgi:hypothetical protein